MSKKETIKEFLARGGQIQKVPAKVPEDTDYTVKAQTSGPPVLMSLSDGEHFFSEKKKSRVKKKAKINLSKVDMELVPESLRAMLKNLGENNEQ